MVVSMMFPDCRKVQPPHVLFSVGIGKWQSRHSYEMICFRRPKRQVQLIFFESRIEKQEHKTLLLLLMLTIDTPFKFLAYTNHSYFENRVALDKKLINFQFLSINISRRDYCWDVRRVICYRSMNFFFF